MKTHFDKKQKVNEKDKTKYEAFILARSGVLSSRAESA